VIRVIALMARRRGSTREAFRAYYEASHAPLARRRFGRWFRGYVRGHPLEVAGPELAYDSVTELWYDDAKAFGEVAAYLASPAGDEIHADEQRFMERPENAFFAAREAVRAGAARPAPGAAARLALAWPDGAAPPAGALRERLAALGPELVFAEHLVRDAALGIRGGPPERPEALTQLWFRGAAPPLAALAGALGAGASVSAMRLEERGAPPQEGA
jgi:uncharacterized protein (TIGR02118 family)